MHCVKQLANITLSQDEAHRALWVVFSYGSPPCFNRAVLNDVHQAQRYIEKQVRNSYMSNAPGRPLFQVIASDNPGTFSLGGDLQYFLHCIANNDRAALLDYARTCIAMQLSTATHYCVPVATIAIVEGECLGGGFECALASEHLIADSSAKFGFPELSFGMFPGMGALALLLRKIAPGQARRMLTEQKIYTAKEMHELGVVDQVVSPGNARQAAKRYMLEQIPRQNGLFGIQKAMDLALPIDATEFEAVVEEWVKTAFKLQPTNCRLMSHLARAQLHRFHKATPSNAVSVDSSMLDRKIL